MEYKGRAPGVWHDGGVFEGGSGFGDGDCGDNITRQWARQRQDGTWDVWEVAFGVIDYRERDDEHEDHPYAVDEQWTYTHCTDPDDPGSTEVDSTIEYGEGSYLSYDTEEAARQEARRLSTGPSPRDFEVDADAQ